MIIRSVEIEKFRAFENASFTLGKRITAISGRNATQKTTVLGMIGQPFTILRKIIQCMVVKQLMVIIFVLNLKTNLKYPQHMTLLENINGNSIYIMEFISLIIIPLKVLPVSNLDMNLR